jgi:hypothetical protein
VSPRPQRRLEPAAGSPGETAPFRAQLPGLGGRFLAALQADTRRMGWTEAETVGLVAAAEERCALWVIAGRSLGRRPRVLRWRAGRLTGEPDGLDAVHAASLSAAPRLSVCLAAGSGRRPPRHLLETLEAAGARVGRVDGGLAASLDVAWAVEVLVAPAMPVGALPGLRERIAAAPRCAWCRTPVLGRSCPRCRGAA